MSEDLPISDPAVRVIPVLGTQVGITDEGDASHPPILLVPGVPGSARDFRYLAPQLVDRFRVIRLDMPGFASVHQTEWRDFTPTGRGRIVQAAAHSLGLHNYGLAGHSMGGGAAIHAASGNPNVRFLVLLGSVGMRRHRGMTLPRVGAAAIRTALRVPGLRDRMAQRFRREYGRMGFPSADTISVEEMIIQMSHVAGLNFKKIGEAVQNVRCPTLAISCEDDKLVQPSIGQQIADTIGAEHIVFETGGHNMQKTRAQEVAQAIRALSQRAV